MRIRYKSAKTAFPVLSEVKSMTGYIKDGVFIIAFGLGGDREVLFCYEEPKIFERLDCANMQLALYDDENRKLKAIVKGMLEERYCK